jgi:uncharacterized damage-inducible protein DinB
MFRRVSDFFDSFRAHSEGTERVLRALDDRCLDQAVAPGHRTLGHVAWHIVATIPEMMNRTGLGLASVDHTAPPPRSAAEIADRYHAVAGEMLEAIRAKWNDETLLQVDDMYGEKWARGLSLAGLMSHEIHHRAQITVLLRQAGRPVPGVFGPSKEEWAQYGMEAPPY